MEGLHYVAKTNALISFVVTAKLICVFVFAYAKRWFSHDAAQSCACIVTTLFIGFHGSSSFISLTYTIYNHREGENGRTRRNKKKSGARFQKLTTSLIVII